MKIENTNAVARALIRALIKYQLRLEKRSKLSAAKRRQLLRLRAVKALVLNNDWRNL